VINIKEEIGQRILAARKAKGLTQKALGELTDDLKQSRINNWEHGIRTPGPEEIKQLAKALDLSPAFLMCLTDEKQPKTTPGLGSMLPLLDHKQACDPRMYIQSIKNQDNVDDVTFIPMSSEFSVHLGEYAFALKITDDSMMPELRLNDILFVDPDTEPKPGGLIMAKLENEETVLVRRYKQLSTSNQEFILSAINEHWAPIQAFKDSGHKIIGSVKGIIRLFVGH